MQLWPIRGPLAGVSPKGRHSAITQFLTQDDCIMSEKLSDKGSRDKAGGGISHSAWRRQRSEVSCPSSRRMTSRGWEQCQASTAPGEQIASYLNPIERNCKNETVYYASFDSIVTLS